MSCNKEQTKRLSTVTVSPHQHGHVNGQLTRLSGSSGKLTSICDKGYKFDGWYDTQNTIISESQQLFIPAWVDMTVEPRFSEIIITLADSQQLDANESLVYYIEHHGLHEGTRDALGISLTWSTFSAGDFPTSTTDTRILIDGTQVCIWPVTYGYNTGFGHVDGDGVVHKKIGTGTYDAQTNTTGQHSTFYRNPTSEQRSSISIPAILDTPKDTISFPTQSVHRGWGQDDCTASHANYYNYSYFRTYNAPLDNSTPTQFPLLQYHQASQFQNHYHKEVLDFTGLDDAEFQSYYHRNSAYRGKRIRNMDTLSTWRNLRMIGSYAYNWPMFDSTSMSGSFKSTRQLEPLSYSNNLTYQFITVTNDANTPARECEDVNYNPGWVSQYANKPKSGCYIHHLRTTPILSLNLSSNTYAADLTLASNYFKSVRSISTYQPVPVHDVDLNIPADAFNSLVGWRHYTTWKVSIPNIDFLENTDLKVYYMYNDYASRKLTTLKPLTNKKLQYVNTGEHHNLINDSLYEERVKLHMDFDSTNFLTQDSTRHVNKLNNYGATIVDT